jgi:hypothetical protein
MDEHPRHQLGPTFDSVGTTSPHWSDGFYFTLGDDSGQIAFFAGLRLYANNDVIDAFTCISSRGQQHNMRYSRRLRPRIDDLDCGAMSVEVIEGLRSLHTLAAPNAYGISYDLRWEGFAEPYNEEYLQQYIQGRIVHERSTYNQACDVSGWIEVGGRRFEVEPPHWTGVRNRSWGIGATGGPPTRSAAPPRRFPMPFGLRHWVLFKLPTRSIFYQFQESRDAEPTTFESQVCFPYGDEREPFAYESYEHDLEFVPGQRRLRGGMIELVKPGGDRDRFRIEVLGDPVWLEGGGYWRGFDDGKGRGVYRGEAHDEGEIWDVSHPTKIVDPKELARPRDDAWAESFARFTNLDDPSETGIGHIECVVSGPYPGFEDI